MSGGIHVCAPAVSRSYKITNAECLCGSYWVGVRCYDWYGAEATCWFCGRTWSEGEYLGKRKPAGEWQDSEKIPERRA